MLVQHSKNCNGFVLQQLLGSACINAMVSCSLQAAPETCKQSASVAVCSMFSVWHARCQSRDWARFCTAYPTNSSYSPLHTQSSSLWALSQDIACKQCVQRHTAAVTGVGDCGQDTEETHRSSSELNKVRAIWAIQLLCFSLYMGSSACNCLCYWRLEAWCWIRL